MKWPTFSLLFFASRPAEAEQGKFDVFRESTRFADERGHSVPAFDPEWRARVLTAWSAHAPRPPVDGGVYVQTTGPRFETPDLNLAAFLMARGVPLDALDGPPVEP